MTEIRQKSGPLSIVLTVVLWAHGAAAVEPGSSMTVSAVVLPRFADALANAHVITTRCAADCEAQRSRPTTEVPADKARPLSPGEHATLASGGLAALAKSLRTTAAPGLTVILIDF